MAATHGLDEQAEQLRESLDDKGTIPLRRLIEKRTKSITLGS